jgi:hypothetical protein
LGQIQLGQVEATVIEAPHRALIATTDLSHRFLAEAYRHQETSLSLGYPALKVFLGSREEIGDVASPAVAVDQAAVGQQTQQGAQRMPEDDLLKEGTPIAMGQTSQGEIPNPEAQKGFFIQFAKHFYSP